MNEQQKPIEIITVGKKLLKIYSIRQLISSLQGSEEGCYGPINEITDLKMLKRRDAQMSFADAYLTEIRPVLLSNQKGDVDQRQKESIDERKKSLREAIIEKIKNSHQHFTKYLAENPSFADISLSDNKASLADIIAKLMVLESLSNCDSLKQLNERINTLHNAIGQVRTSLNEHQKGIPMPHLVV